MNALDSLLTTKLYLPPRRARLTARPRLLALLAEGLTRPLTLISAPAGFGKTTLLSEWRDSPAGQGYPLAWVSLDQEDNDPARFMLYLIAALGALKTGIGETALSALLAQQPPPVQVILTSLVNDLQTIPAPFALVLDDYHVITAPAVQEVLLFLLEAMPASMHLVLLTRADPPLPLARLRARDQLTEIRLPALRFQSEEAADFLNEVMGLDLSPADVRALESRTEGWIAGLQLAAVSLRQQSDRHAFVEAFAGDDRYVMDYLLEEVLQRQPPEAQAFLLKTSILERLNEPLCDSVMGQSGSQAILENLEQANLFVISLDARRYWYRYHPLFADLLRHRLRQLFPPDEWRGFYGRACEWFESNGFIAEAVSQAFAAPDHERAAAIIERHVLTVFYRGETMLVHRWLQTLPEVILRGRPLLCAMMANTVAHAGSFKPEALAHSEAWLRLAEAQAGSKKEALLTHCFIGLTRAYLALWKNEPPHAVIALARKALADLPPESEKAVDPNFLRLRSGLMNNIGISLLSQGDEEAAIQAYNEVQRIGEASGDLLNLYTAIANQAYLLWRHGHLQAAADLCRKALARQETVAGKAGWPVPYLSVVYVSLGGFLLEWNELDAAEAALNSGVRLSRLIAAADGEVEGLIHLAWLKHIRGDYPGALKLLEDLKPASPRAVMLVEAMRARLHVARSLEDPASLQQAIRWAEGQTFAASAPFWQLVGPLTLARVRIMERWMRAQTGGSAPLPDLGPLMQFLQDSLKTAGEHDLLEWEIELRVLQALAWQAQDRLTEALVSLQWALGLAEPRGFLRVFVDEGLPMRRLLLKLKLPPGRMAAYVCKLLNAGGWGCITAAKESAQVSLVEPLSSRELEVLQLLVDGCTNAEIARRLFISLNTTKKHLTHIFDKLAVTDRLSAARQARELGLLPVDE